MDAAAQEVDYQQIKKLYELCPLLERRVAILVLFLISSEMSEMIICKF